MLGSLVWLDASLEITLGGPVREWLIATGTVGSAAAATWIAVLRPPPQTAVAVAPLRPDESNGRAASGH
jgi:hypothetical protein